MKKRLFVSSSVSLSLVIILLLLLSSVVYATPIVSSITVEPSEATNELSEDNQHSITVTVEGNELSGIEVNFTVDGTNAGASYIGTPDAEGKVIFTYTVSQELSSLGTDYINITVGGFDVTVTKDWVDTIPPQVSYIEGINPAGKQAKAFSEIIATDGIDPNPQIFLTDTGTGTVFGPFASGDLVKYIVAPGATPNMIYVGPSNIAFITGQGPAALTAVDASGNTSNPVLVE